MVRVFGSTPDDPGPPARLVPAKAVPVEERRERGALGADLGRRHHGPLAGRGHDHQVPALLGQALPGDSQHLGLARPGRADDHFEASGPGQGLDRLDLPGAQTASCRQRSPVSVTPALPRRPARRSPG